MRAMAVEGGDHLDGRAGARVPAQVDAVDVDRVRQAEIVGDGGQGLHDLPRGDPVADHLVVELGDVLAPLPVLDAAGVHDLDGVAPAGSQEPGHVVARLLGLLVGDALHDEVVVAHDDQRALVEVGHILELFVGMPGHQGCGGRLHHRGVAELGVEIAREVGGGDRPPRARAQAPRARALVPAMVLRPQLAARVHLAADDVRVDVHATGHDHQAGGVHGLCGLPVHVLGRHETAVLHPDVADLAVLAVLRIVDAPAQDTEHHATASMIRSRTSSSVTRPVEMTLLRGMGTLSIR